MKNLHSEYSEDKWEKGELGTSEEHVLKLSTSEEKSIDDALELQLVSIRLQKTLIEKFKTLAKSEGIGYQPLIRQVLTRYVNKDRNINDHLKYID